MATAIQTIEQDGRIEIFMRKPETISRFTPMLGKGAEAFINSALILINNDPKLQECTTMSLYKSTLRAASLELSLDQSLRQGFIIPRPRKIKAHKDERTGQNIPEQRVMEANFQPHYNGVRNLAERTGRYKVINVSPIYEGQRVFLDQLTGLHYIVLGDTFTMPEQTSRLTVANTLEVTNGKPQTSVLGYLGYYKTFKGVERTVYMTIAEIHEHAKKWAKENYFSEYGSWQDEKKRPYMEMKTVFLQLTKTMDLSGKENAKLLKAIEIDNGDDFADLEPTNGAVSNPPVENKAPATQPVAAQMTYEQAQKHRIETPWGNVEAGTMEREKINELYWSEMLGDIDREALRLILSNEYNVDIPDKPKVNTQKIIGELMSN